MLSSAVEDRLRDLVGVNFESERQPRVRYRVSRLLGAGSMAAAFFGLRFAPEGDHAVVLKIVRPDFIEGYGATAALSALKEAESLSRLNERVPPSQYVVRLLDAGRGWVPVEGSPIALPWLALEFVNGGAAGTTLHDRVAHSIRSAGCAFDVRRTKRALHCLVEGLDAVHGAGVVHRDIKPNNILCSGSGSDEIFKLADFGIARPHDMAATFGGILVGTPGYASPEQAALDARRVGPWSDVFSLACVVYFMLTGEDYFRADAAPDVLLAVHDKNRRSVAESDSLCTELRKDGVRSTRVDRALANATAAHPRDRPQSAADLGSLLEPLLQ